MRLWRLESIRHVRGWSITAPSKFGDGECERCCQAFRERLTLAFVVDATLGFSLKLSPDAVQKLIQALAGTALRAPNDTGRVTVVHGGMLRRSRGSLEGAGRGGRRAQVVGGTEELRRLC